MNLPSQFLGMQMGMGRTPGFGSLFGGAPGGGAGIISGLPAYAVMPPPGP